MPIRSGHGVEPASTRAATHVCPRATASANTGANSSSLSISCAIADKRERQLACLLKIVIVDFQTLDVDGICAGKTLKISESSRNDVRRMVMQTMVSQSHTAPNQRATLCDGSGDEIADAHERATIQHESA